MSDRETVRPLAAPVLAWLDRAAEHSARLPGLGSSDIRLHRRAARELSDLLAREFTDPVPDGVLIDDILIAGGARPLRARRFRRADAVGPQPTMLWLHGGGWTGGTIDETLNDRTCADRTLRSGVQIISLEYRLAPEHPFPAPVDDAVAALADLRARDDELGVDAALLGIGGNSAGATVAATTALRLRGAPAPLHHQALEVLPAALRPVGEQDRAHGEASGLDDAEQLAETYRDGAPLADTSPLDAPSLDGAAPALILAAEHDPLRDGAVAYAEALRRAGVAVVLRIGEGHVHGSPGLTARWRGAREWRDAFAAELARAYGTAPASPSPPGPRSASVPSAASDDRLSATRPVTKWRR
jgi:acetyl esterase